MELGSANGTKRQQRLTLTRVCRPLLPLMAADPHTAACEGWLCVFQEQHQREPLPRFHVKLGDGVRVWERANISSSLDWCRGDELFPKVALQSKPTSVHRRDVSTAAATDSFSNPVIYRLFWQLIE